MLRRVLGVNWRGTEREREQGKEKETNRVKSTPSVLGFITMQCDLPDASFLALSRVNKSLRNKLNLIY